MPSEGTAGGNLAKGGSAGGRGEETAEEAAEQRSCGRKEQVCSRQEDCVQSAWGRKAMVRNQELPGPGGPGRLGGTTAPEGNVVEVTLDMI